MVRIGIVLMIVAAVLAILCIVIFAVTGNRLKKKLKEEYGDPRQYSVVKKSGK